MTENNEPTDAVEATDADTDTDEVQGFGPVPYPDLGGGATAPLANPLGVAPVAAGSGGTLKNIVSTNTGKVKFTNASSGVKFEGQGVVNSTAVGPTNHG